MNFDWVTWANPVSFWWVFLTCSSIVNILFWIWTRQYFKKKPAGTQRTFLIQLSAVYVFVCAFRSILPRADVQRICLFDTWFSNVLIGRFVATIAELCFIAQWAIVLNQLSKLTSTTSAENISKILVPLIAIAECFSWYAVISTHYLGNTVEESTWAVTYTLIAICLALMFQKVKSSLKYAIGIAAVGTIIYILFMVNVDVPMYWSRWQLDNANSKKLFGLLEGIHDLNSRWVVTHDIKDWKTEIPWMSLYFSVAVWTSLALCYVPLTKEQISKYLKISNR